MFADPIFEHRAQAGRKLARALLPDLHGQDVIVLGLPRGGVPVAAQVAEQLRAPLDVWVVRKLGVPGAEELAMGAIASGGVVEFDRSMLARLGLPERSLIASIELEQEELARRERLYRAGRPAPPVRGRTVVLVDDGMATGATMHAAVSAVRAGDPLRIVVAVPVAAAEACERLAGHADVCVCLSTPEPFWSVGSWYRRFEQTSDAAVRDCLERSRSLFESASPPPMPPDMPPDLPPHLVPDGEGRL
jgi:putative phosphoribosyl transferase